MEKLEFEINEFDQPVGLVVPNWSAPPVPNPVVLEGRWCRVEPVNIERHARSLFDAYSLDKNNTLWTYLPTSPAKNFDEFEKLLHNMSSGRDPLYFSIVDLASERALGVASYMRITPNAGTIEVGGIVYSPLLQRKVAATEAMYLMMRHAFELGYRRYEWKCNALNAASRAAAQRLGFSYEGIFRQANVIKGRNRDTAWFSVIDSEWSLLKRAFEQWLDQSNFDANGNQKQRLSTLTAPLLNNQ